MSIFRLVPVSIRYFFFWDFMQCKFAVQNLRCTKFQESAFSGAGLYVNAVVFVQL